MPFDTTFTTDITLSAPPTEVLLPHVPSALIRLALADLRKVEAMPETYDVNMYDWHEPKNGKCSVCLAGSVMASSLGVSSDKAEYPGALGEHNGAALDALNSLRVGWVEEAFMCLSINESFKDREIPIYSFEPESFHLAMRVLASDLEMIGQ